MKIKNKNGNWINLSDTDVHMFLDISTYESEHICTVMDVFDFAASFKLRHGCASTKQLKNFLRRMIRGGLLEKIKNKHCWYRCTKYGFEVAKDINTLNMLKKTYENVSNVLKCKEG